MNTIAHAENTAVALSSASSLLMSGDSMDRLERIAEMMFTGRTTVPQHLRGSKGDCFAVVLQSMQWGMNPFAVAQKTHVSQSGALGYEAQLISAALSGSGALKEDPEYEFLGDWSKVLGKVEERKSEKGGKYYVATYTKQDEIGLGVICRATLKGESKPRELTVMLTQCYPRFSTQWATDPKQQICYVAVRKWGRLHKPGVLLGVYTPEELEQTGEKFMGPVDEVKPEPMPYPADQFEANLQKWREVIEGNRKTADDLIVFAQSRNPNMPFTEEQKATLRAIKPVKNAGATDAQPKNEPAPAAPAEQQTTSPAITFDQVNADLTGATDIDALYTAADLIGEVPDPQQRAELTRVFEMRQIALEQN
ncbi:MAG: recombinase RecT [Simplicispira sp.]|nr:recombinase RecT [Simplicispira sp.]